MGKRIYRRNIAIIGHQSNEHQSKLRCLMGEEDLTRSADEWGEYFKAADDQALFNYAYLKCCD